MPGVRITLFFRDSENKKPHEMIIYIDNDSVDEVAAWFPQHVPVITALSDATLKKIEYTKQDLAPDFTSPPTNTDNEIRAKFSFYTSIGTVSQISIPAFKRDFLVSNSSQVDRALPEIVDFVNFLSNTVSSRGLQFVDLKSALESYSKRRGL